MNERTVGICDEDDVITIHIPSVDGNDATLCGITANEEANWIGLATVPVLDGMLINCRDCKVIWSVCRSFTLADFAPEQRAQVVALAQALRGEE